MAILGKDLVISVGGVAVAASKSCDISIVCDGMEVAPEEDGRWKRVIGGRMSWRISATCLFFCSGSPLRDSSSAVGQTVTLRAVIAGVSGDRIEGRALCRTFRTTGTVGNLLTGQFEWEGSGPLS